ncbi:MAG: hypothetical protein R3C30_15310 [Hyphomonadaceae bacterium]
MFRKLFAVAALAMCLVAPATAQDAEEAIVVTGSRLAHRDFEAMAEMAMPHVTLRKRADSVVVDLYVRNDTRDAAARAAEMRQALRGLESRARAGGVTLALIDATSGIVRPFSLDVAERSISGGGAPDTSMLAIHLRTSVQAGDTLDTINERIRAFVSAAPRPGRTDLTPGTVNLVLNNPEQYHAPLVAAISAEGRSVTEQLGPGYGVNVTGLERQVSWRRTGELELTLFLPYTLMVLPRT